MIKPRIAILALTFFGVGIFLPILGVVMRELWYALFFLLIWLFGFVPMVIQCLVKRIVIDASGVEYITLTKRYKMSWDEIQMVGVGYVPLKRPGSPRWIYFSAIDVSLPLLSAGIINDKYFMVHSRETLIDEIKKYWSREIDGLNAESEFERLRGDGRKFT